MGVQNCNKWAWGQLYCNQAPIPFGSIQFNTYTHHSISQCNGRNETPRAITRVACRTYILQCCHPGVKCTRTWGILHYSRQMHACTFSNWDYDNPILDLCYMCVRVSVCITMNVYSRMDLISQFKRLMLLHFISKVLLFTPKVETKDFSTLTVSQKTCFFLFRNSRLLLISDYIFVIFDVHFPSESQNFYFSVYF